MGYLIFAVALSAALTWFVVWRSRRPKSMRAGIDEFSRGLRALAPKEPLRPHVEAETGEGREDTGGRTH